jgi:hypothetical protein
MRARTEGGGGGGARYSQQPLITPVIEKNVMTAPKAMRAMGAT